MNDLEELAQRLFTISRRSGPNDLMVVCPFHKGKDGGPERQGSLSFSIKNGMWFCHRCGEGGGLRSLLKQMGVLDEEGMELLLEKAQDKVDPRIDPLWHGVTTKDMHVPEDTLGFFDGIPRQMIAWGFHPKTIQRFEVGYDKKSLRITFPLRDYAGNLLEFSGRALTDHPARYKVYGEVEYERWGLPTYPTARKELIVWNYDRVYPAALHDFRGGTLVVEGFKACMWLWQLGFRRVVALLGSNMSQTQEALLARLGGKLYLFLDNDKAGNKKYMIADRLAKHSEPYVPKYEGQQPDTLTREQVFESIANCVPYEIEKTLNMFGED